MEIAHLAAFNLALLAAMASPGPALLLAIRNTLQGGWLSGVLTGIGLAIVAACWTLLALLGLEAVFTLVPWAYGALRIGGALYLLWIAFVTWRDARRPLHMPGGATPSAWRPLRQGALVNLANPKSVLFAAAVIAVVFPAALGPMEIALVAFNHLVVEIAVYTLAASLLSRPRVRAVYLAARTLLDRITAGILGALGLRLLVEK